MSKRLATLKHRVAKTTDVHLPFPKATASPDLIMLYLNQTSCLRSAVIYSISYLASVLVSSVCRAIPRLLQTAH